jgi:hypothetical protein
MRSVPSAQRSLRRPCIDASATGGVYGPPICGPTPVGLGRARFARHASYDVLILGMVVVQRGRAG